MISLFVFYYFFIVLLRSLNLPSHRCRSLCPWRWSNCRRIMVIRNQRGEFQPQFEVEVNRKQIPHLLIIIRTLKFNSTEVKYNGQLSTVRAAAFANSFSPATDSPFKWNLNNSSQLWSYLCSLNLRCEILLHVAHMRYIILPSTTAFATISSCRNKTWSQSNLGILSFCLMYVIIHITRTGVHKGRGDRQREGD